MYEEIAAIDDGPRTNSLLAKTHAVPTNISLVHCKYTRAWWLMTILARVYMFFSRESG